MNEFNFTQWLAIVGPIATLVAAMYYTMRDDMKQLAAQHREDNQKLAAQHREDNLKSAERWAELLKAFCDFKNVTVERFSKLENRD